LWRSFQSAEECIYADQPGHSDRPVQEPRVKLAPILVAPAATSRASSETSKESISSCAFSAMSVMTLILLSVMPLYETRAHPILFA
jgi:hypothetical protein